jgi:hypothetical protein
LGDAGFFGPFDEDLGTPNSGAAGPVNFWIGRRLAVDGALASGSDASLQTMFMELEPLLKLNKAVRVVGRYRIGSWVPNTPAAGLGVGELHRSEYVNSSVPGVQSSFSPGYWNILRISARLPWGVVSAGKRPSFLGNGLIYDGTDNYTTETISLGVPYGPLSFGVSFYPSRVGSVDYWNRADRNAMRRFQVGASVVFSGGPLELGIQDVFLKYGSGPESQLDPAKRADFIPLERMVDYGTAFIKYDNGFFFFNSEYAFFKRIDVHRPSLNRPAVTPGAGSPFRPTYIDHRRFMVEFGGYSGPAKLSLLWAWISGPDRRHGVLIDRNEELRSSALTDTSVFLPYSRVFVFNYGGGNGSFSDSANGYLTDAVVYAARLDWAAAANLNLYVSLFHASRVTHGYGWGYIRPGLDNNGVPTGNVDYARQGDFLSPAPAVPASDLGYELDWGFNWRLLENFAVYGEFGLWKPGRWFNYACVDRSNPGWKRPGPSNQFGVVPGRDIPSVFGMEISLIGWF